MTDNTKMTLFALILVIIVFGVIFNFVMGCDGTVVRGLFWLECIKND